MTVTDTISSPNQSSRGGQIPRLFVCHLADGTYEGTKAWFLQAASQTSSNFIIARDGRICQCVPLDKMAWCNGTTPAASDKRYFGHSTVPEVRKQGGNANQYSVSIECEGFWKDGKGALPDAQLAALVQLIQDIQTEVQRMYGHTIPLDRDHIVGHCEVNPKTKPHCPGENFPWAALMERLAGMEAPAAGALYRVQVGAFASKANAEAYRDKLREIGVEGFVVADGR